jgi:hypothetical protein
MPNALFVLFYDGCHAEGCYVSNTPALRDICGVWMDSGDGFGSRNTNSAQDEGVIPFLTTQIPNFT